MNGLDISDSDTVSMLATLLAAAGHVRIFPNRIPIEVNRQDVTIGGTRKSCFGLNIYF